MSANNIALQNVIYVKKKYSHGIKLHAWNAKTIHIINSLAGKAINGKNMKCNHDCLNCVFDDCINDSVYSEKSLYKNRSEQQKNYQKEYQKKKREEARKNGLCIVCRKKQATHGSKCYECYIRQKRHDKKKYSHERETFKGRGLCYFCGAPVVPGKNTCAYHLKIYQNVAERLNCNSNVEKGKAFFRKLNDGQFRKI